MRAITESELALVRAIGNAQRELESGLEPMELVFPGPEPVRRAWRILEDALIALGTQVATCPACGEYLDADVSCLEADCPYARKGQVTA